MRGRGARGEVVAAVGDEGRQRVHVMRVLHNRDFIRLKDREERLGPAAPKLGGSQLLFSEPSACQVFPVTFHSVLTHHSPGEEEATGLEGITPPRETLPKAPVLTPSHVLNGATRWRLSY